MTQPNTLRLADSISRIDTLTDHQRRELLQAAAELRRLYAKCELQKTVPTKYRRMEFNAQLHAQLQMENDSLRAQRDELRKLYADAEESEALRERLSALLKSTAIALRGPEPELTNWGWHDLPERAAALVRHRDELLEALRKHVELHDGDCICEDCAAIAKAQQLLEVTPAQMAHAEAITKEQT